MTNETFLITNHFSFHNKGCQALVETMVELLRRSYPDSRIAILSYTPDYDAARTDIDVQPDYWERLTTGAMGLLFALSRRLVGISSLEGHSSIEVYRDVDIVICSGGDVFSEDYGWKGFVWQGSYLVIPILLGKRIFLAGHTIGPYRSTLKKIIMGFLFSKVDLVAIRDTMSAAVLTDMGVRCPVMLTADTAFLLKPSDPGEELRLATSALPRPVVGLSVSMGITRFAGSGEQDYLLLMANLLDHVIEALGGSVVLISHSTGPTEDNDDRVACSQVANLARNGSLAILPPGDMSAGQVKGLIGLCDLLVGSRTHATIAALSQGVPAIAVGYSMKSLAIFSHWFDQGDCVFDVRTAGFEHVAAKVEEVCNDRHSRGKVIRSRIRWARSRAEGNGHAVRSILSGNMPDSGPGPLRTFDRWSKDR